MANVPLSMEQLENITSQVAQELLEDWAINDRFDEDKLVEATQNAVNDTVLVINSFMEKFNDTMIQQTENKNIIL
jgi:hypothetical protein